MLPDRNRPVEPPCTETPPSTEPPVAKDAAGPNVRHTDYNLQPLPVPGLDHYVDRETDERFRVS